MKIILFIFFFFGLVNAFSQEKDTLLCDTINSNSVEVMKENEQEDIKLEVVNESDLKYKMLYFQMSDSINYSISGFNVRRYFFENDPTPKFYFANHEARTIEELINKWSSRYDILTMINDSLLISYDIVIDTLKEKSLMEYRPYFDDDSIFGYKLDVVFVSSGCQDTNTNSVIFENEKGRLIFKDHNNIGLYTNKSKTELYLISSWWCANKFLLYKITK